MSNLKNSNLKKIFILFALSFIQTGYSLENNDENEYKSNRTERAQEIKEIKNFIKDNYEKYEYKYYVRGNKIAAVVSIDEKEKLNNLADFIKNKQQNNQTNEKEPTIILEDLSKTSFYSRLKAQLYAESFTALMAILGSIYELRETLKIESLKEIYTHLKITSLVELFNPLFWKQAVQMGWRNFSWYQKIRLIIIAYATIYTISKFTSKKAAREDEIKQNIDQTKNNVSEEIGNRMMIFAVPSSEEDDVMSYLENNDFHLVKNKY